LLVLLLVSVAFETAAICKWVDEDGVVHYAETCPEGLDASEVEIEPPPSQERVDAAAGRSETVRAEIHARKAQSNIEKTRATLEKQQSEETSAELNQRCAEARWNLQILRMQLPVYYDEEHQLHDNRSLHHYWYEGPRTYLDDQQRADEILRFSAIEERTCTGSSDDIRDRIMIYMEKRDREICNSLRDKLAELRKIHTGIPSDEMRELEATIANKCR
jgi:hypothetical protein